MAWIYPQVGLCGIGFVTLKMCKLGLNQQYDGIEPTTNGLNKQHTLPAKRRLTIISPTKTESRQTSGTKLTPKQYTFRLLSMGGSSLEREAP